MKRIYSILIYILILSAGQVVFADAVNVDSLVYADAIEALDEKNDRIYSLLSKCRAKGISPDYEEMRYAVLERYLDRLRNDIANGVGYRTEENGYTEEDVSNIYDYNIESLNSIADEAEENLCAYLDGTKEAMQAPFILTSDTEINKKTVNAKTLFKGKEEIRKVFLNGYGHYITYEDFGFYNKTGANLIQTEIGISTYCKIANGITDWITGKSLSPDAEIELSQDEYRSGKQSVKFSNATEKTNNCYMNITQPIKVEPNTTYTYSLWAKGENISYFSFKTTVSGTYKWLSYDKSKTIDDWTEFKVTFTTGAEQTTDRVYLSTQGITDAIYIDDVSLIKDGSEENLLKNGGFEYADSADKILDADYMELWKLEEILKKAEESNIKIDLLLSPHYFLWSLAEEYPDILENGDSEGFRLSHKAAKEACKFHAQTIAKLVKNYKSVNSICLANEPKTNTKDGGDDSYYRDEYTAYLKGVYGNIDIYNEEFSKNYEDFSQVPFPTYASHEKLISYDYCTFNDKVMTEWIKLLSDSVKEVTDKPVHIKSMSYVAWADDSDKRWLIGTGVDPQEYSEYVDINGNDSDLRIPANYDGNISEYMDERALQQSMLYDFLSSVKEAPVFNSEDHILANKDKTYRREHNKLINAAQWMGAVHGRVMTATWTWNDSLTRPETYESIIYRPDLIETISEINMDLNRLSNEVYAVIEKTCDVGILYSETSRHYNRRHMNTMYKVYEQCLYNGLKPGFVTEADMDKADNYKLIIVPYATHVKETVLNKLVSFKESGGVVVAVGDGCLKYNQILRENSELQINSILDGAKKVSLTNSAENTWEVEISEDELFNTIKDISDELNLCEVKIIDNENSQIVRDVEYISVDYNGKKIISICNYDWDRNKNISVCINGKIAKNLKELRSGKNLTEQIDIESYKPILLEAEVFDADIEDAFISGTEISCQVSANADVTDLMLVFAVYNADGTLCRAEIENISKMSAGEALKYKKDIVSADKKIKLMLINKDTLKPYTKSIQK